MKAAAMAAVTPLLAFFAATAAADWSGTGKLGGVVTRAGVPEFLQQDGDVGGVADLGGADA